MPDSIAIVGAGVGGLACAARLASRGYNIDVYEKLPICGGRNNLIEDRGFKFDTGPSFVLMPELFEELFSYCGEEITDYLDLKVLDINYKIFYPDGDTFTVYKDSSRTREDVERMEKGGGRAFDRFISETDKIYKAVKPLLYRCFTKGDLLNPQYLSLITKIRAFESYWGLASKFFKEDKLRYAFTFEAMFIGVSPFSAPAFYSIITYVDHAQKIRHPIGGMYQIPLAIEKICKKFGVNFHFNSEIKYIRADNGSIAIETQEGNKSASKIVVNADFAYAQSDLLRRKLPDYSYSCSVYLIYLGLKKKVKGFEHHNLFFSRDLKDNLKQVFQSKEMPSDPSFYVHVPTVTDSSIAPAGKDILYLLVPVANLDSPKEKIKDYEDSLRKKVFDKINKTFGINLEELIEVEHRFYPEDFISRYNIRYGATFGLAHNLRQSAFFRPANTDRKIKDLYFVGASTQPGGGLPVVIAGSRIVADLINKE